MCKISVIIPIYNSEKYIEKTLQSVFNQKYKDFEIIFVDDGSTDNSVNLVKDFLRYNNLKHKIVSQENQGLSAARNAGLKVAKGEYICYLDSDDVIDELHLYSLYLAIIKYKCDVSYCNYELTDENNRNGYKCVCCDYEIENSEELILRAVRRSPAIIVCGLLIRKSFLDKEKLYFNENMRFGEDSDYIWRTLFACKKIAKTNMKTYKYLVRTNSIMRSITQTQADIYLVEFSNTIKLLENCFPQKMDILHVIFYRELIGFIHAYAKCSSFSEFSRILKKIDILELWNSMKKFPDIRVKVSAFIIMISPRLYFNIMNSVV